MTLREKIQSDMKDALKTGQKEKLGAIRLLWSAVRNKEIDAKKDLSDEEIHAVVQTLAKQRRDSIDQYERGNRPDLVEKEKNELNVLLTYLPAQLSKEELSAIVEESIRESGAQSAAEIGKVMKVIMPKVKGKADGKLINQLVAEKLK